MIHFELFLLQVIGLRSYTFACGIPIVSTQFVGKKFSSLNYILFMPKVKSRPTCSSLSGLYSIQMIFVSIPLPISHFLVSTVEK